MAVVLKTLIDGLNSLASAIYFIYSFTFQKFFQSAMCGVTRRFLVVTWPQKMKTTVSFISIFHTKRIHKTAGQITMVEYSVRFRDLICWLCHVHVSLSRKTGSKWHCSKLKQSQKREQRLWITIIVVISWTPEIDKRAVPSISIFKCFPIYPMTTFGQEITPLLTPSLCSNWTPYWNINSTPPVTLQHFIIKLIVKGIKVTVFSIVNQISFK